MSKIGKKPIVIPKDSKVKVEQNKLILNGPKGTKEIDINSKIFSAEILENNLLSIKPLKTSDSIKRNWGMTRSIINNAVKGVSVGHEKTLEMTGVGYRAALKGNILNLQLGFSHDINYEIPKEIKLTVEKQTIIKISGLDKDLVSRTAAEIISFKPTEPYKGKGIKEKGQYILRKEGKKK